jgi:hypothetical protein
MFVICSSLSSAQVSHLLTSVICSRLSSAHICHLLKSLICSSLSSAHISHLLTSVICSRLSSAHICHLLTSVICSSLSSAHICHLLTSVICSSLSSAQVSHLLKSLICSSLSSAHISHLLTSVICSRLSSAHVCHLLTSVICSSVSSAHICHLTLRTVAPENAPEKLPFSNLKSGLGRPRECRPTGIFFLYIFIFILLLKLASFWHLSVLSATPKASLCASYALRPLCTVRCLVMNGRQLVISFNPYRSLVYGDFILWLLRLIDPSPRLQEKIFLYRLRFLFKIVDYILGTSVMQQLILLLTSFLLACGFPAFLIGFYSIRIWESRLRSLSIPSVSSDSPGSSRDTSKSNRGKQKDKERRREKADRLARETVPERKFSISASLFCSCKKIGTQSILRGPKSTSVDVVSVEGVPPSTVPDVVCPPAKEWPIPQHQSQTQVSSLWPTQIPLFRQRGIWRCWEGSRSLI